MNRFACIAIAGLATTAHANLIVNGGFEEPTITEPGTGISFFSIPGWSFVGTDSGTAIEVQRAAAGPDQTVGFATGPGDQFVELDQAGNYAIEQTISVVDGAIYTLSFDYAPRNDFSGLGFPDFDFSAASTGVEVYWNDELVLSIAEDSPGNFNDWRSVSLDLHASGPSAVLRFTGAGISDSVGGLIDNVTLVPAPGTAGLLALAGLAAARRRR